MNMGEKLRSLRGDKTQDEIAKSLGISKSAYAMYEQGNRVPRDEVKIKISKLFGVSVQDLFFAGIEHYDDDNRLCRIDSHYYDAAPAEPKPVMRKVPAEPYTVAEYLAETAQLFRGHEILQEYASELGAHIINCTEHSMIDAYQRAKDEVVQ